MICGFLGCASAEGNPVISTLPSLLKLNVEQGGAAEWIRSTFQYAAEEISAGRPGSETVLAKLSELLFMEAVRRYAEALLDGQDRMARRFARASRCAGTGAITPHTSPGVGPWMRLVARSDYRVRRWPTASFARSACRRCTTSPTGACRSRVKNTLQHVTQLVNKSASANLLSCTKSPAKHQRFDSDVRRDGGAEKAGERIEDFPAIRRQSADNRSLTRKPTR